MNNKPTIVYFGAFMIPDKNAAAHRVLNNAKIFSEIGYDVVFCGMDNDIDKDEQEFKSVNGFLSCPSKYPNNNLKMLKSLIDFDHMKKVLEKCTNVELVVAYNMHALPLWRLINYCRHNKIKIIADVTEWYENKFSFNPKKMVMSFDTFLVMRILHAKLDGIISISKYLTDYYSQKGCHVVQIPPLVDVYENVWKQPVLEQSNLVEFVYAGNRGRNKKEKDQLGLLVNCFSHFSSYNNFILTVIGINENDFRNDYPEALNSVDNLSGRIEFKGRLTHTESIYALLKADYSVFFRERTRKNMAGFPTKFAEAVTAGIGIVANDISNIADYKEVNNFYITKTTNEKEISSVIKEILTNGNKVSHVINDTFDYRNYVKIINEFLSFIE